MKRLVLGSLAALAMLVGAGQADAAARVKLGVLSCDVAPGVGFVVGVTHRTHIEWLVFAATNTHYYRHALAGNYVGASGEATLGVGVGANWLIGGSHRSFALQPISVQAQTGVDLSLALSNLTLR